MNKALLLNKTLVKVLADHGITKVSGPNGAMNDQGNYHWVQSIIELPNGEKYILKVHPLGHSRPLAAK